MLQGGSQKSETAVDHIVRLVMKSDQQTLYEQAHEHLRAGKWQDAASAFTSLLERDEADEGSLVGLAQALDRLGDYDRMYKVAQQAVELNPDSALALACQARALQKLERLSEATVANDQALLLDTNLALAWFNRSGQQLLQERYPEALRSAERATELDATDARAWSNKALALVHLNRPYEALEAVKQGLAQDSDYLL